MSDSKKYAILHQSNFILAVILQEIFSNYLKYLYSDYHCCVWITSKSRRLSFLENRLFKYVKIKEGFINFCFFSFFMVIFFRKPEQALNMHFMLQMKYVLDNIHLYVRHSHLKSFLFSLSPQHCSKTGHRAAKQQIKNLADTFCDV